MLPIKPALVHASPSGVLGWGVWFAVRILPFGSALRWVSLPVSLFKRGSRPRLVSPTTMASADFSPPCGDEISPGNCTMLPCTTTAFTSTGKPDDFAVLPVRHSFSDGGCQLVVPYRPSMRFLSIGSQVSPSLPSHGRSPFRAWLQIVVSFIFMFWFSYRGLAPHLHRAHAGHTQAVTIRHPVLMQSANQGRKMQKPVGVGKKKQTDRRKQQGRSRDCQSHEPSLRGSDHLNNRLLSPR